MSFLRGLERLAFAAIIALFLLAGHANAQNAVALAPSIHPTFLDATGKPLSGGFLYFYSAGTTTLQNTYADNLGTIANPNPVPLDASGSPSNASGAQIQVWLLNSSYKVCGFSSALVQQFCWDNVSAYQILNGVQNITFGSVTSDPSGLAGEIGYRSDIPCLRIYTTFWDCAVELTAIQTLTNKTLASPVLTGSVVNAPLVTPTINSVVVTGQPSTYLMIANAITTGTTLNTLTKMNGATAVISTAGDTGGAIGVTVAGAGTTGNATVQQNGFGSCVFDNATTAGDYVQISATVAGNCHDAGALFPPSGQIVGRVTVTAGSPSTDGIILFGPELKALTAGATAGCTNFTPVTVTNNNAQQNLMSCTIPANALAQGSQLEVYVQGISSTASASTLTLSASLGGGTPCTTLTPASLGVANNQPWNLTASLFVLTSGAGGTANWSCNYIGTPIGGGATGPNGVIGAPTISVNTTVSNTLQITVQMSVANAGNSVTEQGLKAVIY